MFASLVKLDCLSQLFLVLSFHLTLGWKRFTCASIVGYNCLAKSLSCVSWPHNNKSILADWHRTSSSVGQGR